MARTKSTKDTAKASATGAKNATKAAKPKAKAKALATKSTAAPRANPNVVTKVRHDDIARVAYAIWERKGRPVGQDEANWKEALREIEAS